MDKENNTLFTITNTVAKEISKDFFRLKSSYKSLMIYEVFFEILRNRGVELFTDFDHGDYDVIQEEIVRQLEGSLRVLKADDHKLQVIESFYLGLICNTLVHLTVPVPEVLNYFGKYEANI